jgi:hypothetical protein
MSSSAPRTPRRSWRLSAVEAASVPATDQVRRPAGDEALDVVDQLVG